MTGESVLKSGRVALVTGAASGIGLAACKRFAALGMRVAMADIDGDGLEAAAEAVAGAATEGRAAVLPVVTDVAARSNIEALRTAVYDAFGEVGLLMNNAVTRLGGGTWDGTDDWRRAVEVNLWGVVNGVQAFVPAMLGQGTPCLIVNTGSKQGITNPPGNAVYNMTKAAVRFYTESLEHELRNTEGCRISAHLLVPGWTTTGKREHKSGAWLPGQVIDFMLAALGRGEFYILCPDNEVTPEMDRARILWAAGDITEPRPPLSRWHPDHAASFKEQDG